MASSPPNHSHSALIFSGSLLRKLENHPSLRLPTTYVGVRRVRPSGGGSVKKLDADGSNGSEHNDDEWTPNAIVNEDQSSGDNNVGDDGAIAKHNGSEISYKVTNPDGTERRMTKHEKKQLKYKLAQAKREVEREKRQIKHEQLIQEAKKAKYERKKLKRLERQERKKKQQQQQEEDDEDQVEQEQVCQEKSSHDEIKEENQTPEECTFTAFKEIDEELAAMRGDRSGIPPAMLAPAAACVALDMKALKSTKREDEQIMKTMFDRQLTSEWARELKQSMIPAEELREKEDMRPMAYKVIPELWNRLCPKSLCACKDEEMTARQTEIEHSTDEESTMNDESQHSLGLIRNTSPLYDEVANAVFRHLHKYSNLHISSGEIFGCDFLLYDGKREDRHSFAGLRIYTCDKKDEGKFPIPSAYDMTGFVRTMNTARKLALIATVAKDEGEGDTARVLIVDLALEKVLSVPTHKKKGSTEKRKSEIETSSGLAKHKR